MFHSSHSWKGGKLGLKSKDLLGSLFSIDKGYSLSIHYLIPPWSYLLQWSYFGPLHWQSCLVRPFQLEFFLLETNNFCPRICITIPGSLSWLYQARPQLLFSKKLSWEIHWTRCHRLLPPLSRGLHLSRLFLISHSLRLQYLWVGELL